MLKLNFNTPPLWLLVLLSLPIIQLGFSYYFSAAIAAFALLFVIGRWPAISGTTLTGLLIVCCAFMLKSAINAFDGNGSREVLLPLRELTCFMVMMIGALKIKSQQANERALDRAVLFFLLISAAIVVLQYSLLARGFYFGFPLDWFVKNRETLVGIDNALYHQTRVRPTLFYGEPSYGAFVIFSLLTVALVGNGDKRYKLVCIFLSLLAAAGLQSVAGIMSISTLLIFWIIGTRDEFFRTWKLPFLTIAAATIVLVVISSNEFNTRLHQIQTAQDPSFVNRMLEPLQIFREGWLSGKVLGQTTSDIAAFYYGDFGDALITNALLWILIYYGVLSIPMFLFLFRFCGVGLALLYVVITMNFNGDFFSFDKAVIVSLVLGRVLKRKTQSFKIIRPA